MASYGCYFMVLRLIFAFLISFFSCTVASETSWAPLKLNDWVQGGAKTNNVNITKVFTQQTIDATAYKNKWVKVIASANIETEFDIWINTFDEKMNLVATYLYTQCRAQGKGKVCYSVNWVDDKAAFLKIAFWPKSPVAVIRDIRIYSSVADDASFVEPMVIDRFDKAFVSIKENYYRSSDVAWEELYKKAFAALLSPQDVDSIPGAVSYVIRNLPGSSHMRVHGIGGSLTSDLILPGCQELPDGSIRIDVVGSPYDKKDYPLYLQAIETCLLLAAHKNGRLLLNLTNNRGGDVNLFIAALSPIIDDGRLLGYEDYSGKVSWLEKKESSLQSEGQIVFKLTPSNLVISRKRIDVFVNQNCGSSCEALALILKRRFKLYGSPTGGWTTANMVVDLNEYSFFTLTTAWTVDGAGGYYPKVHPDVFVAEENVRKILHVE